MIAKVIVDVPARETDRPFDYLIPEPFRKLVRPGMRVGVPFGPRVLQGFVVGLAETSGTDPAKLRPLGTVLDATPVLTEELLELAFWLSRKYVCPQYVALASLLPGALKAKAERTAQAAVSADDPKVPEAMRKLIRHVERRGSVSLKSLLKTFEAEADLVAEAFRLGFLGESRRVKDRVQEKKRLCVEPLKPPAELSEAAEALRRRAPQQAKLLEIFADGGTEAPLVAEIERDFGIGPSAVKALAAKGFIAIKERVLERDPYAGRKFSASRPLDLTPEQEAALAPIRSAVAERRHAPFLLHGVTGSGKTEVYLQAMQECLAAGREAILLVPEISLTPQTVNAFKSRFGDRVAVLHSRLSVGERYDEWRKIAEGRVRIAIGARSAVFAPFTNIGLIIVDEEHESSYKQEESPKYHARDVALERGRRHGAAVVLGSATPALESYLNAHRGVYTLLEMKGRALGSPLPQVDVVDMRQELRLGNRSMFSVRLREALERRIERGEQAVLLLNRRGYSTFVMCRSCGYTAQCPHCDITLTYHRAGGHSRCHYCGYAEKEAARCPSCDSEHIRHFGAGTQRVEEELSRLFPGIRTIRMDVDTTSGKGAHEALLADFQAHKADVLLGTQMVAKGLDFPLVTLVGVISADTTLRLADFRAAERTFQLLTQVAGRAGRHKLAGEVIVQTYTPEHYSIQFASAHDYRGFARRELLARRELGYPPYARLALATMSHADISRLVPASERFASELKRLLARSVPNGTQTGTGAGTSAAAPAWELLGPVPSPIPKLKDRYRFQCMIKYRGNLNVGEALRAAAAAVAAETRDANLAVQLDMDPQMLL